MANKKTVQLMLTKAYESHALDSSGLLSFVSFVIVDPFGGCHN